MVYRVLLAAAVALGLQGCIVTTVVGTVADVAVEAVKVPFKVGGAIVDAATESDEEKALREKREAEKRAKAEAEKANPAQ